LGENALTETWEAIKEGLLTRAKRDMFICETFMHNMPVSLLDTASFSSLESWGWATPSGAHPITPEIEEKIVRTMIRELSDRYCIGLSADTAHDRLSETEKQKKRKFLCIGGSHAIREAETLAARGYEVITCAVQGWRPNVSAVQNMVTAVEEALQSMDEDDIVVVHCLDNIAYMARSEEGGDLPIRRFVDNTYHIEGDLVLVSKERLFMFFKNCLPLFRLLENRKVVILTPGPRYLQAGCCSREDHAPNRGSEGFEKEIRKGLADRRGFIKDFLFTNQIRGFAVLNPGLCLPISGEDGEKVWGQDPVHPLQEGYERIVDLLCEEAAKMAEKASRKRAGEELAPAPKRQRVEQQRPRWIEAAPPPPLQMGFVRGGSRGNSSGYRGGGRGDGRAGRGGGCGGGGGRGGGGRGGGGGPRGGYDGRPSYGMMRRDGGQPYGRY
jgi:uncharacterized membrane protein YgcG